MPHVESGVALLWKEYNGCYIETYNDGNIVMVINYNHPVKNQIIIAENNLEVLCEKLNKFLRNYR